MAPTWNNSALAFLTEQGRHAPPSLHSPFQRHHYRSSNDISCTFPCNIHALLLFFSFCLTFTLRNDRSRAQRISAAWHFSSFTQLHTETALHSARPCFFVDVHSWLFLRLQLLHTLFASLIVLFLPLSVLSVFELARVPCFFACQTSRNYPRQFFRGGYSYIVDLPFRIITCRFLHAVVSRTWDLVCINLWFASRDFVCARSTATSQ